MTFLKVCLLTLALVATTSSQLDGGPPQCKENETYRECGTCEVNCNDPESFGCTNECRPAQCQCNHGFARAKNGTCIPRDQCGSENDLQLDTIPSSRVRRDTAEGNQHQFKSPNAGRRKRQAIPERILLHSPVSGKSRQERQAPLISVTSSRDGGGPQKHTRVNFLGAPLAAIDRDDVNGGRSHRETQTDNAALPLGAAGKGDAAVERKSRERRDAPAVRINVKSTSDKPTKVRIIGKSKTTIETEKEGGSTKAKLEIRPARDTSKWDDLAPGNVDLGPGPKLMNDRTKRSTPLVTFIIPEDKSGTSPVPTEKKGSHKRSATTPLPDIERHIKAEGKVQSERIEDALQKSTARSGDTDTVVGANVTVAPLGAEYISMAPLVLVNETQPPPTESPQKALAESEGEVQAERIAEALQSTTTEPTAAAATTAELAESTTEPTEPATTTKKVTLVSLVTVKPKKEGDLEGKKTTKVTLVPIGTKEVTVAALKTTKSDDEKVRRLRDTEQKTTVVPLMPLKVTKVHGAVGNVTKFQEEESQKGQEQSPTTTPSTNIKKRIEAEGEVQAERIAEALQTTTAEPPTEASTEGHTSVTSAHVEKETVKTTKVTLVPLGTKKVTVALLKKGEEKHERRRRDVQPTIDVERSLDSEAERVADAVGVQTSLSGRKPETEVTDEGRGITLIPLGTQKVTVVEPEPGVTIVPEAGQQKRKRRSVGDSLPQPDIGRRIESEGEVQSERIADALQVTTEAATVEEGDETATTDRITLSTILTGPDMAAYNTWESLALARIQGASTAQPNTMRNSLQRVESALPTDHSGTKIEPFHYKPYAGDDVGVERALRTPQAVPEPLESKLGPDVRGRRETLKDGTPTLDKPGDQALEKVLSNPENVVPKPVVVDQPTHDLDLAGEPLNIDKLPSEKAADQSVGKMTPIPEAEPSSMDRIERKAEVRGSSNRNARDVADMHLMIDHSEPRLEGDPK